MVIVVPAFTEGKHGNPPTVPRVFTRVEASGAPQVGGGVDQPGGLQAKRHAQENTPHHHAPSTNEEQHESQADQGHRVVAAKPSVEGIFAEVGRITRDHVGFVVLCSAAQDPAHVRPQAAVTRRMWIAVAIRVRVMNAMRGGPFNWTTLQCQRTTQHENIFKLFGVFIAAVGYEPVVTHADAETTGNPVEDNGTNDRLPVPHEQSCNRGEVEQSQKSAEAPVDRLALWHCVTFLIVFQFNLRPANCRRYLARRGRNERVPKFAALRPANDGALLGRAAGECVPPNAGMTMRSID